MCSTGGAQQNGMTPIWVLGVILTGLFLCQFHGSLAGSDESIELVGRGLLQNNDYSDLQDSEASQQGLQKRHHHIPCGQPPVPKHGSSKIIGRVVYYSCNRGFAMVGKARSVCMPNCRWQFPAPYCVAIYYGPRGPKGAQGPDGMRGAKGENGQPGPPGWRGRNGMPGMTGLVGAPGIPGVPGWPGPPGPMGFPGQRGVNGHDGQPGRKGSHGETGMRGRMGPMGPQGPKGPKGDPGAMGAAGDEAAALTSAFSVALGISNPSLGSLIIWQRTIYNGDGDFQTNSGTFLCRVPGVYRFTYIFQIFTLNAYVVFKVNDVTVWSTFQSFNSYYEVASASLIISLNHGDKVWLEIKDDCNGISKASTLLGHLISPGHVK